NPSPASLGVAHQVNRADTMVSLTDGQDPSLIGATVRVSFAVSVTAPGAGTPSGSVQVTDGVDSCTGTIATGFCDIKLTTAGGRTLKGTYAGDTNFNGSTSADEAHTVNRIATTTSITADGPDPSVVGQPVSVQYTVTGVGGTPTGNVT